jgi:hypothetical protein
LAGAAIPFAKAEISVLWLAEISSGESCIDSFLAQAGTLSL